MAERQVGFDEDPSCLSPSELDFRKDRLDSLIVGSDNSVLSESLRSGSHSPVPAWKRTVDLKTPSPPPTSPPPFKVTSMVTSLFNNFFKLQKVEPTGIRPLDVKCNENHVPVVYSKQYDIHGIKKLGLPKQPILVNKPAQVFSAIKGS